VVTIFRAVVRSSSGPAKQFKRSNLNKLSEDAVLARNIKAASYWQCTAFLGHYQLECKYTLTIKAAKRRPEGNAIEAIK
jgi:hypothetical protein